jgi:hypothetical protein
MTPIKTFGDYVVCFEAMPEDISARTHFIEECGWTPAQFRKIKDFPFFCAHVAIYKDAAMLADDYLGCCSYETESEFYQRYAADYFADMVHSCAEQIKDPALDAAVTAWSEQLRNSTPGPTHI